MSFKLIYTKDGSMSQRDVNPTGDFSIVTTRNNFRYYDEFSGSMTFKGDDFDWIMEAGKCVEIFVECEFRKQWKGVFTLIDCLEINLSKRYLEVVPRTDDEYRKFEPWMRLEMNIIPPYNGIESRVGVLTTHQYEIERKVIRIDEPYDGVNSENWVGYSVNDFIKTNGVPPANPYRGDRQVNNSLIDKITKGIFYFPVSGGFDAWNRLVWLDSLGFELTRADIDPDGFNFVNKYWRESMFTLSEVMNYYDEDDNWEYCELVYLREVFKSFDSRDDDGNALSVPPPSGLHFEADTLNSQTNALNVTSGRWIYNIEQGVWIRRYLALHQQGPDDPAVTGDGFDFSPLIEVWQSNRRVRKQVLRRNRWMQTTHGDNWYNELYGITIYQRHMHRIDKLLEKFIEFMRDEGTEEAGSAITKDDIVSSFFFNEENPYLPTAERNHWNSVLIGQNSDVKRPLASEKATREEWSFEEFINTICELANCAWAIIDGQLVIEHRRFFENGLSYSPFPPPESIFNPFSIVNTAKNKGFLDLSNAYAFDGQNMPKFEIFKTEGGEEPKFTNSRVVYDTACVNNKPSENKREVDIPVTLDYTYARSEGKDEGVTLVQARLEDFGIGQIHALRPELDEFGRYGFSTELTLESLLQRYHDYGRNHSEAKLNREPWMPLRPFKNVIQRVNFHLKAGSPLVDLSPYSLIITGLGYGVTDRVQYNTRDNYLEYELRLDPIEYVVPPDAVLDWHVHFQAGEANIWVIEHEMNNTLMMKPQVFDLNGEAIEYQSFRILNSNTVELTFSEAMNGEAHFIALNVAEGKLIRFIRDTENMSKFVANVLPLNKPTEHLALTPFVDRDGTEILPDSIEYITSGGIVQEIIAIFTGVPDALGYAADILGYVENIDYEIISDDDTQTFPKADDKVYGRPVVIRAGEEIMYNSDRLLATLREIGFSENVTAQIIVVEKDKT